MLGMLRMRSQRGRKTDGRRKGKPGGFRLSQPFAYGVVQKVSAATSFYAAFRPRFRQIGRGCTSIRSETPGFRCLERYSLFRLQAQNPEKISFPTSGISWVRVTA
jgi:hypothetical protein